MPTLFTIISVQLAYPWFFVPVLVVVCAVIVDQHGRGRASIAARADYEHRELIRAAVFAKPWIWRAPSPSTKVPPPPVGKRHVMNRWPTTRMQTRPLR